ncbi:MAG: sodium-dependent transporter [Ruminococcaceae bacterium]|nr:sodium-dependent transporter [Oscillospiraceae bacterium]
MREKWSSRSAFVLAAIGSAVGLGNAWRFPGLAAKYGGGAFLFVYLIAMLVIGIPLLMMEISVARYTRQGAPGSMRALNKKAESIGWIAVSNGIGISIYYAAVFAWVILMFVISFKFMNMTGDTEAASNLWAETIKTTGTTSGFTTISWPVLGSLIAAWVLCYVCIRNGTTTVGKVVKFTVSLPVICLLIMAVRGISMPGAMAGMAKLFIPDWTALSDSNLWVDAVGQVFYSLSTSMAIMFAYGSFLDKKSNIVVDTFIISFSDMFISVLAGIVMFTTMAGVGMLDNMSASGIATAFIIYPQAIVKISNSGVFNMIFAFIFYFCLITLAIDSLFSIIEGISTAVSDKFKLNKKTTTLTICIIEGIISLIYVTGAGLAVLDIVDYFINSYTLIITGVLEMVAAGWLFKTTKILEELNRNTGKFKMPSWWFLPSIKFISPIVLLGLFAWNLYNLIKGGGIYGAADGYSMTANVVFGWCISLLILISGLIIRIIVKVKSKKGYKEDDRTWEDFKES